MTNYKNMLNFNGVTQVIVKSKGNYNISMM